MFVFISTVLVCHAVGLYLHILTVSAWHPVGLCFILQFQCDVLLVYIYVMSTVSAWRAVGFRGFHSQSKVVTLLDMQIHVLSALQDNYMYLVS
jgi:hypothetical protein